LSMSEQSVEDNRPMATRSDILTENGFGLCARHSQWCSRSDDVQR
jgi:hypothetical protein